MQEGKRQKQVAGVINEELNDIFRREGLNMMDGGMVSIVEVKVTPDLLEARIYLSFFQVKDPAVALRTIADRGKEIRRELGSRVKTQFRRVPELRFFIDDTLEQVFKMDQLIKKINEEKKPEA